LLITDVGFLPFEQLKSDPSDISEQDERKSEKL